MTKNPQKAALSRYGVAEQEQYQDETPQQDATEKLIRTLEHMNSVLQDLRKGALARENSLQVRTFATDAIPATGRGIQFECRRINGGIPWNSFRIQSVGGAGTTLTVSINGSEEIPVAAGDGEDHMEIETIVLRVGTSAAGTARIVLGSYIPGLTGLT